MGATRIQVRENEITACCPVHHETRPSFGVALNKPGHPFNCFSCHQSGLLPKIVMLKNGATWKEAFSYVNRFGTYSLDDAVFGREGTAAIYDSRFDSTTQSPFEGLMDVFDSLNLRAAAYLKGRRVHPAVYLKAGIKRMCGRLIFPWYYGRELVGSTSRSYLSSDDRLRGLPLLGFNKHNYIYRACGSHDIEPVKRLYVTEGECGALRLQSLQYEACAIGGTKPTKAQADQICRVTDQVVLLFDNDSEGADAMRRLNKMLSQRIVVLAPTVLSDKYSDAGALTESLANTVLNESNLSPCFLL